MLACHEPLAVGSLDLVLDDFSRSVSLGDFGVLVLEEDARTSGEPEN
jgi:hypothetical protein